MSGVLFGLAFAALLYVLQSGFSSFKFSRNMFLEYYVHFGRNLLVTLSYLTVIALGVAYFPDATTILTLGYYLFATLFLKTRLDYLKQLGYIHTLFSKQFVPSHYGPIRAYFRYIRNLGVPSLFVIGFTFLVLLIYPILIAVSESGGMGMTPKAFFYSTIFLLVYSLVITVQFIPNFFEVLKLEHESGLSESNGEVAETVDNTAEKKILRQYLVDHGVSELDPLTPKDFLDGTLCLDFVEDRAEPEAWFNVRIETSSGDVIGIHDEVCRYGFCLFEKLKASQVDVNTFVLSFHIYIERKHYNMFFRSTRSELREVLRESPIVGMLKIENKVLDDVFRNLTQGRG